MSYGLPLAALDPSKRGAGVMNLAFTRATKTKNTPNNPLPRLRGERVASLSELGEGRLLQCHNPFLETRVFVVLNCKL